MEEAVKMEKVSPTLITELIQGKELAKQLCNHFVSSSSSSHETNEFLIDKILSSYDKALAMLNGGCNVGETKTNTVDSHTKVSPRSEVMDHDDDFKHKAVLKKRKTMPRWTEQVKICSTTGLEGSLDDGYSWRKYGQKNILGTKFPRGYYRCTHRYVQGCLATKQVQRSDEDPTLVEVTYRGRHTCTLAKHLNKSFPPKRNMGVVENQLHNDQKNQPREEKMEQPRDSVFTFQAEELQVKTENLDTKEDVFTWFCLPSSSQAMIEDQFMQSFSPAFISPETSELNNFCWSAFHLGNTGLVQNVQTSESDTTGTEIVSAPTSVSNSPIPDLDIILDKGDFDIYFPFNTPEFFSS